MNTLHISQGSQPSYSASHKALTINIAIKSLAKKRLKTQTIELPNLSSPCTLQDFLTQMVTQKVTSHNQRLQKQLQEQAEKGNNQKNPLKEKGLPTNYLDILTNTGKVTFGELYNDKPADIDKAITNALESYTDGLFAVFVNDKQIEGLDTIIQLDEQSVVSFIRLTFLTGSFW